MAHEHAYLVCEDMCIVEGVPKETYDEEVGNKADKSEMGVVYLASKYNDIVNSGEVPAVYNTPSLSNGNRQGYTVNLTGGYTDNIADIYTMLGGDGNSYISNKKNSTKSEFTYIVEFPDFINLTSLSVSNMTYDSDNYIRIYGSVDGSTYESLGNIPSSYRTKTKQTINITKNKFYKYVKFESYVAVGDDYIRMYNDLTFSGVTVSNLSDVNKYTITTTGNAKLTAYQNGQIVKIKTPANYVVYENVTSTLNINNIGAKNLPSTLAASTCYTLIYNGTAFVLDDSQDEQSLDFDYRISQLELGV